ncbi:glycoside hydrolase family 43 protein [Enterococcus nangangensis]|uniref:glycoside hydrolase family 43 protein n=1 Tax=Enterococcus nangangensis TaxID=2559926 RepID=UPI0010F88200|nr:glycoside hydrolase family 43 protein [Enterococcus nangangensis]
MWETKVKNPILRGFNPDPNILKVGDMYYIAVSSFEWLPGVRVYNSKDLVNWQYLTDILTHEVNLKGNPEGCSIWAPQLSYADGLFYCIYTDVKSTQRPFKDSHNYLITSSSITGPWSEPIYMNSSGFDPSLFHDKDGRKWFLNEIWDYRMTTGNKSAGIVMQEYDAQKESLVGQVYKIFDGTSLAKTEAPHIYRHGEYYYLITAEGGTGHDHSVTICRSKTITGPYDLDPNYPMLTASDQPQSPLQCSGHASLVQGPTGDWYIAYLCTRPLLGKAAILGRETAIQEVVWTEDGWLRLANGTTAPEKETIVKTLEPDQQKINTGFLDDFNESLLPEWNALRIMPDSSWCDLASRPGYLRLISGESPQSTFEHHLLAIRQKDFHFIVTTKMTFNPQTYNQMAGVLLFLNSRNYLYMYVTHDEELGKVLRISKSAGGIFTLSDVIVPIANEELCLKVEVDGAVAKFYYRRSDIENWKQLGEIQDVLFLAGGFTGNFVGLACHDMDRKAGCFAEFSYFEYQGLDQTL